MGELIYCKNPIAANPYYLDEASINIYSLEELSYFLYNNPFLVSASFMSMDLCNWIGRELKEKDLYEQLKSYLEQNAPLSIFVSKILTSNGYLSNTEIKKTVEQISAMENKSEAECRKIRADRLMEKQKLVDAIYEYESILKEPMDLSAAVQGDVYHNLGTAYARLFLFDRAVACYENAYIHNKRRSSLKEMLYAIRCMQDDALYEQMVVKHHIPPEVSEQIKSEVTQVSTSQAVEEYQNQLNRLRLDYGDEDQFLGQLGEQITSWQKEYMEMSRI